MVMFRIIRGNLQIFQIESVSFILFLTAQRSVSFFSPAGRLEQINELAGSEQSRPAEAQRTSLPVQ